MVKFFQLACFVAIASASVIDRRGLSLENINSPEVNQQQDIEADEGYGTGQGGDGNTVAFNSFNNVGGVTKTSAPSNGGFGLFGGLLFKRNMDLSKMASPDVFMMQNIQGMGPVGVAPSPALSSDSPFAKFANFGAQNFIN